MLIVQVLAPPKSPDVVKLTELEEYAGGKNAQVLKFANAVGTGPNCL
jgi:hypothetical protein